MKPQKQTIDKKVKGFPARPGVYLMKDNAGKIIYIGKAGNLHKRVQSYFRQPSVSAKIGVLVGKIKDVDFIETPSEVDALLLESQLVERYRPRYNTRLKDDKSFPLIKITHERFPRFQITRDRREGRAVYLGPYTDAKLLREALRLIHAIFPIRKCGRLPKHPCLYYHLNQCLAPCIHPEVKRNYDRVIREIKSFVREGKTTFIQYLTKRMEEASRAQKYEEAQFFKEQIQSLSKLRAKRFYQGYPLKGITLSASAELKHILKLRKLPQRIVCFDVSNIAGRHATASKVSFYRELPDKNSYRRYKIRTVVGIDDYAMIQEALSRMLCAIKQKREHFLPDLIVIDGGRGHLNSAYVILKKEGFETISIIAIAKKLEEIYTLGRRMPLALSEGSSALNLLKRIRDEAHRFAIRYHHILKERALSESLLDSVPGIGAKRKRILLKHFSSLKELRNAPLELVASLPGMSINAARKVLDHIKR